MELSYLGSSADNGINLSDAIAKELRPPLDAMSLEMIFRGLSPLTGAFPRSETTNPLAYLAAQDDLEIVKRRCRHRERRRVTLDTWRQELPL